MDLGDQGVLGGPRWMIWWMIWMGGSSCHEEDDGRAKMRFGVSGRTRRAEREGFSHLTPVT